MQVGRGISVILMWAHLSLPNPYQLSLLLILTLVQENKKKIIYRYMSTNQSMDSCSSSFNAMNWQYTIEKNIFFFSKSEIGIAHFGNSTELYRLMQIAYIEGCMLILSFYYFFFFSVKPSQIEIHILPLIYALNIKVNIDFFFWNTKYVRKLQFYQYKRKIKKKETKQKYHNDELINYYCQFEVSRAYVG